MRKAVVVAAATAGLLVGGAVTASADHYDYERRDDTSLLGDLDVNVDDVLNDLVDANVVTNVSDNNVLNDNFSNNVLKDIFSDNIFNDILIFD